MAKKIIEVNHKYPDDDVFRGIAWKVPKSKDFSEGIKYAFCYIHQGRRVLGYDNERGKGHHRHIINLGTGKSAEEPVCFDGIKKLFDKFRKEVSELRKRLYRR